MSDFERLAAAGREADAQQKAKTQKKQRRTKAKRKSKAQRMTDNALGSNGLVVVLGFAVSFVGMLGAGMYFAPMLDPNSTMFTVFIVGTLTLMVLVNYLLITITQRRSRERELAWLRGLPFEFNVDSYLSSLGQERMNAKAELSARFEAPVPEAEREAVSAVIAGACKTIDRSWMRDGTLIVRSADIETWFMRSSSTSGSSSYHSNRRVHQWFRDSVGKGLLTIHARYPIRAISVSIDR